MNEIASKVCVRCQSTKPVEDFNRQPRNRDGRQSYCRACNAELTRIWRAGRKETPVSESAAVAAALIKISEGLEMIANSITNATSAPSAGAQAGPTPKAETVMVPAPYVPAVSSCTRDELLATLTQLCEMPDGETKALELLRRHGVEMVSQLATEAYGDVKAAADQLLAV